MKNKKIHRAKEIVKTKNHIKRIFPHARKVSVRLRKGAGQAYKSFISVSVPPKKELVALKYDSCPKKSLDKAHQAIIKQIHKVKTQWERGPVKNPDQFKLTA
ncbi:MAG: hypothetical protein H6621_10910 [Halobacteriovoraceae bacterium]|nr:hypothetical protein [Halobacteriovoraceae bacterium]MCB9095568.1 hypothetical protein [Halobacteriovoraceae bacterium]